MTKKHFNALARALAYTNASLQTIKAVADVCRDNNPPFDRARFIAATTGDPLWVGATGETADKSKE